MVAGVGKTMLAVALGRASIDAGRPDEQHVGGVLEEPQRGELVDELAVDARLGVEVEVVEPPGGGQVGEAFQAGVTAGFGGGDLDIEEPFQERRVRQLVVVGVVEFAG
jgi:hypothetical protein